MTCGPKFLVRKRLVFWTRVKMGDRGPGQLRKRPHFSVPGSPPKGDPWWAPPHGKTAFFGDPARRMHFTMGRCWVGKTLAPPRRECTRSKMRKKREEALFSRSLLQFIFLVGVDWSFLSDVLSKVTDLLSLVFNNMDKNHRFNFCVCFLIELNLWFYIHSVKYLT